MIDIDLDNEIGELKPYFELTYDDENGGQILNNISSVILFGFDWEDGTKLTFTELDMTCAWIFCFAEDSDIWRAIN